MSRSLAELFGPEVRVASSRLIFGEDDLLPDERPLAARAVEKRKREVAAGRVLGRRVLAELGFPERPLLRAEDRTPIWPAGVVGSISHSTKLCVAVAARASKVSALGVDVEEATPLADELLHIVVVDREARWLAAQAAPERGLLAKLIFSAKECAYKAQYIFTKKMLEFTEVELSIDRAGQTFEASVLPGVRGFYVIDDQHLITGIKVPS